MSTVTLNLEREMASLDEESAEQFQQAMLTMLRLVKSRRAVKSQAPFYERIAGHPAIGTWPEGLGADEHIASVRGSGITSQSCVRSLIQIS
jgi:hypothetical protein